MTPFPVYFDTPFIRVPKVPYSPAYRGMPLYTKQAHFPLVGFLVFIPRYIDMPNFTWVYRHLVKISQFYNNFLISNAGIYETRSFFIRNFSAVYPRYRGMPL